MGLRRALVSHILKNIINIICKIDTNEVYETLKNIDPMFIIMNHVNFIDAPILATHLYPLKITGLVKKETWNNPILGFLFNTYKAVPINRNGAFTESFKQVKKAVENKYFVCIAPEGTRSRSGVLQRGKAGIIQLALETNVPIIPVSHNGCENLWNNLKKLKRTPIKFSAGKPFKIKGGRRFLKSEREMIIHEIMGQIACLLPEDKRGIYAEQAEKECKYLEFISCERQNDRKSNKIPIMQDPEGLK